MSFVQVVFAMQGSNRQFELEQQMEWERCRWQTTLLLNVHTAKGKSLKPQDLVKFPWEIEHKVEVKELSEIDKTLFDKWDNM